MWGNGSARSDLGAARSVRLRLAPRPSMVRRLLERRLRAQPPPSHAMVASLQNDLPCPSGPWIPMWINGAARSDLGVARSVRPRLAPRASMVRRLLERRLRAQPPRPMPWSPPSRTTCHGHLLLFVVAIFNLISESLHLPVLLLYAGVSSFTDYQVSCVSCNQYVYQVSVIIDSTSIRSDQWNRTQLQLIDMVFANGNLFLLLQFIGSSPTLSSQWKLSWGTLCHRMNQKLKMTKRLTQKKLPLSSSPHCRRRRSYHYTMPH